MNSLNMPRRARIPRPDAVRRERPEAVRTTPGGTDGAYCSAMIRSNSTIGLTGTCSLRVTVAEWMVAVQVNGAS